jgi:pyrimidine and pyridine-specific 5'-nucleotidase
MLWKSHALGLTEGDPVGLVPPSEPSGWEPLVRGLYFRERNWSNGICQNLTLMKGHNGFVTAMKLKGRKTLVTGSYDETIRVWDLYTGVCKKVLKAKAIACLDFLNEEGILAAGLYDSGRVMVWDMKNWSLLQTLSGHNRGIRNVALNQDYLVSVGQDKAIVVWDWQKGIKLVRFGQQSNVSLGVSIVDHDKIVAVTVDGIIRTFCIQRKEMIGQFDLTKLSSSLASQLSGLKGGTLMLQ